MKNTLIIATVITGFIISTTAMNAGFFDSMKSVLDTTQSAIDTVAKPSTPSTQASTGNDFYSRASRHPYHKLDVKQYDTIIESLNTNSIVAQDSYNNKNYTTSGKILSIKEGMLGGIKINIEIAPYRQILCRFSNRKRSSISNLKLGDEVETGGVLTLYADNSMHQTMVGLETIDMLFLEGTSISKS